MLWDATGDGQRDTRLSAQNNSVSAGRAGVVPAVVERVSQSPGNGSLPIPGVQSEWRNAGWHTARGPAWRPHYLTFGWVWKDFPFLLQNIFPPPSFPWPKSHYETTVHAPVYGTTTIGTLARVLAIWIIAAQCKMAPVCHSYAQSINQSINQSFNHSINGSIDQTINHSINRSIDQTINQTINHRINQSIETFIIILNIH